MNYRIYRNMFMLAVLIFSCQSSFAEGTDTIPFGQLFTWATTGDSPDIFAGIMYAILGFVGALITVFGLIGGGVPGTAGYSEVEAGMNRLEARAKALDGLIYAGSKNSDQISAVQEANTNFRAQLNKERWRQFLLAAGLYALLGAFFSSMIAQNLLQAIVIGAGWTAYLGALGLKKDFAHRKAIKDETTEKLEKVLNEAGSSIPEEKLVKLHEEAQVSKAL